MKKQPAKTSPAYPESYLGTSISGWGRSVMLALLSLGIDGREIFRECGLDPDAQGRSLVRNPVARMQYVWQVAEDSVDDKAKLATEIVTYLNASSFHALGFGLYASNSIADMFTRMCRFREIVSSSVNMEIEETSGLFCFRIIDLRPVKSYLTTVVMLLYLLKVCRELGGPELKPRYIEVPWQEADYDEALRGDFDVPIRHGLPHQGLAFTRDSVRKPLPSAQSQLASFQDKLCREYLHSLDEHRHLVSRVRLKIIQGLTNDDASINTVAKSLHMSPRSLQRRLSAEDSNYRDILREVRTELVNEYAQNPDVSATQMAYMLGFSGLAQFTTAFRSWFGMTLSEYRASLNLSTG